jgi:ligand-binding SRPBCC domain-containing protein
MKAARALRPCGVKRSERAAQRGLTESVFKTPAVAPSSRRAGWRVPVIVEHVLERSQILPGEPGEVFAFFADAHNLEDITPPWLGFRIVTPRPIAMRVGALIEYRLTLHRVPVRWLTRIEEWEPGLRFVDTQIRGPYRLWHHTHTFEAHSDGTLVRDRVRYAIPLGPAGELAHRLLVRRDLERIFDHRQAAVAQRLDGRSRPEQPHFIK